MSVRRPVRATAAGRAEELPERLRCCVVEDWVTPEERPPKWWWAGTIINADDRPGETMSWLKITAWTRREKALDRWAEEHCLTWSEFLAAYDPGHGEPRWRDWWSFREQMLEAGV